jgi:hypothetical protein
MEEGTETFGAGLRKGKGVLDGLNPSARLPLVQGVHKPLLSPMGMGVFPLKREGK